MASSVSVAAPSVETSNIAIAIHGGAGTILKSEMSPELEKEFLAKLDEALNAGYAVLNEGGSSLDAVVASVKVMEDSPLFNAGKGAVFTHEGVNELDAAIMDGSNLAAGAVAGVRTVKNPIELARKVMTDSPHVMLAGKGADEFAKSIGLDVVDPKYFYTERRWLQLQQLLKAKDSGTKLSEDGDKTSSRKEAYRFSSEENRFGTVGAVALDKNGKLAAATSTGGMTNKRWGRIGDAPIIGAGTYANAVCAVSATGHGEYFIRAAVAHDICARVEYQNLPLAQAANIVVMEKLVKMKGEGGIIAVDNKGNVALPFNSKGMYRASIDHTGKKVIAIYQNEI